MQAVSMWDFERMREKLRTKPAPIPCTSCGKTNTAIKREYVLYGVGGTIVVVLAIWWIADQMNKSNTTKNASGPKAAKAPKARDGQKEDSYVPEPKQPKQRKEVATPRPKANQNVQGFDAYEDEYENEDEQYVVVERWQPVEDTWDDPYRDYY